MADSFGPVEALSELALIAPTGSIVEAVAHTPAPQKVMSFEHTILITAPGGNIGTKIVPLLLQDNVKLILPTSNANRLKSTLPLIADRDRVIIEQGGIDDAQWVEGVLRRHSVERVLLVLTGVDELIVTLNFFDAMQHAGTVRHLVYLSACGDFVSSEGFRSLVAGCSAMHVLIKPLIELKLAYASYSWTTTVLGPTFFFDNDLRIKNEILHGHFGHPIGEAGVSRVSTEDIALAARNSLIDPERWSGKKIMIGSKRLWKGSEIARLWGSAIGKEVTIREADKDGLRGFENMLLPHVPVRSWPRDLGLMYDYFARVGFGLSEEEYSLQVEVLGHAPISDGYEAFVWRTGQEWKSSLP